jgi:hypothetical protein
MVGGRRFNMTKISKIVPEHVSGSAVLDAAHMGDIEGAFGTIHQHDTKPRLTWKHRIATLMAIIGPGAIRTRRKVPELLAEALELLEERYGKI